MAGLSHQQTDFSGTLSFRPETPLTFGGATRAAVYGAEFGVERRLSAAWAVRMSCSWRQTGDNRLPVYVDGVRDVRPNAGPGEPDGDQTWHRTTAGCGAQLTYRLGGK